MKRSAIRRKTPMPRGKSRLTTRSQLVRHGQLARVTKKRARRLARFTAAFLSPEYVLWMHSQPCAAPGCGRRDIECAHVDRPRSRGGRWYEVAPLCALHHREQEKATSRFDAKHGTDLRGLAAGLALRWKAFVADQTEVTEARPLVVHEGVAEDGAESLQLREDLTGRLSDMDEPLVFDLSHTPSSR